MIRKQLRAQSSRNVPEVRMDRFANNVQQKPWFFYLAFLRKKFFLDSVLEDSQLAEIFFLRDVDILRHDSQFGSHYKETPRLSTYFIALNIHQPPFSEEKFRHQFVQSINVETLVRRHVGRLAMPHTV
jgi:hypothetical protein